MNKSSFLVSILLLTGLVTFGAQAQSIVDPGVSVHNYKHPNKAAKAKANRGNDAVVYNLNTVESYSKQQRSRYVSNTPKYAPRPVTLVVTKRYTPEGVDINPLISPRNYKTPTNITTSNNTQVADYYNKQDSTAYPTVD
ncbi:MULTISPECIES: hypothetical protein [Dyadobacter]|jgi:hypothetical protein|uniref:Uncharacterized protein n=1 Tax=Dyadobacter chenhuakuii TaxID=2909339 RepID=A0A9X1QBC8_9BACT|nr:MULTISPECIES: hypothetical protein [Dyadobacter]MCE7072825.1 hypothetical protein [Dyadobacter sp. CY327]MCF2493229.1 hypothetical protein [Dyadobacter chenhuakuii]MCF2497881.1 hypothetical protein [Dyadobacter chenhuakuii]MCF2517387.1 hypothetical protein [Dyadobacter sp. CY351]USJ32487.1 hypothetical protein NFI80_07025 [Dyadobacter chenhuakuii]